MLEVEPTLVSMAVHQPEVAKTVTKPLPAPLQKYSLVAAQIGA